MSSTVSSSPASTTPTSPDGLSPKINGGPEMMGSQREADMGLHTIGGVKQSPAPQGDYNTLKVAFDELQIKFGEAQSDLRASQEELKRIQERDFVAHAHGREPHDKLSQQFLDVFRLSTDWARDYFKIDPKSFVLDEHEAFKGHLQEVLWDYTLVRGRKLNVRFLVQAVVADIIAKRLIMSPFGACEVSLGRAFCLFYEEMLKENKSEAHKWRAITLAGYEKLSGSRHPPAASQPLIQYRQCYYNAIAHEIDSIVCSIVQSHFPESNSRDERFRRSMVFIEAAGNLALKLGKQAAELRIIDKSWFDLSGRDFVPNDERMKGRLAEEEEDNGKNFEVDIILQPGFLKYGNDDGENLEQYAVWVPAILDLRNTAVEHEICDNTDTVARDLENDVAIAVAPTEQAASGEQMLPSIGTSGVEPIGTGGGVKDQLQSGPQLTSLNISSQAPLHYQQPTVAKPKRDRLDVWKKRFRRVWSRAVDQSKRS